MIDDPFNDELFAFFGGQHLLFFTTGIIHWILDESFDGEKSFCVLKNKQLDCFFVNLVKE